MIWLAFATMTAAAALVLVWPLARRTAGVEPEAADLAFYKSQLAEVESDGARAAVAPAEAAATRAEIARRLLAAAGAAAHRPARPSRGARLFAIGLSVVAVPAGSIALYLRLGHPGEPDAPLLARTETAAPGIDLAAALPRIEAHLAAHPEDGRGFALVAPVYMRMGRYDDAARAYGAALRDSGEDAPRRAALGQALVMAAEGVVTSEARAAFDQALADDPKLPEARFFTAVAAEQDGDKARATQLWTALLAETPPDAPWRASAEARLAALSGPSVAPAGPNGPGGAAIAALPPDQQLQAIRGMVEGLAGRLAQNGRDTGGWLRLIRAYKVLGDQGKARAALADARKGLDGDTAALGQLEALGRELGLET